MPGTPAPRPQDPASEPRPGGSGPRGNSFANAPNRGALHRWPCSCRWCLDGSVPEMSG